MTLRVSLNNFGKFAKAAFTFDQQLVLISGRSGVGKTTIVEAILFAIDGKKAKPRLGHRKCSVTLTYTTHDGDKIVIDRQHCPSSVWVSETVRGVSKTCEKDVAMATIDKWFHNIHNGYMPQDGRQSFINMTPSEIMKHVQKLAFGSDNPDVIYKKCLEMIHQRKKDLDLTTKELETTRTLVIEHKLADNLDEDNIKQVDAKLKQLKSVKHTEGETEEIVNLKVKIKALTKEIKQAVPPVEKMITPITTLEQKIDELKKKQIRTRQSIKTQQELKKQLDEMPIIDEQDLDEQIKQHHLKQQQWDRFQKEQKKLNQMNKPSGLTKEKIDASIKDLLELSELKKELKKMDRVKKQLGDVTDKIATVIIPMSCPECEADLSLWADQDGKAKLVTRHADQKHLDIIAFEEAKQLEKQQVQLQIQLVDLNKKQLHHDMLETQCRERLAGSSIKQSSVECLQKCRADDEAFRRQSEVCASFQTEAPSTNVGELIKRQRLKTTREEKKKMIDSIKIECDPKDVEDEIESLLAKLRKEKRIEDLWKNYQRSVAQKQAEKQQIEGELSRLIAMNERHLRAQQEERERERDRLEKEREMYVDLHQRAQKTHSKINSLVEQQTDLGSSFPRAKKMASLIKQTECLAIEETINVLNIHAQIYLDHFLDGVTVSLDFIPPSNQKGEQFGEVNGTLRFVATKREGAESFPLKLDLLSGGERARVSLAFTVAMAEIYQVRLLLLDEFVASLDQETTSVVIETLCANFHGQIICIAHQTTTGVFNQIISLS